MRKALPRVTLDAPERYIVLSDGGKGRLWKIEYRNFNSQLEAQAQADSDQAQHGGQWIVAEA